MTTERRRYFRIDDRALIKYRVIAAAALDTARAEITAQRVRADNLGDALHSLDLRLSELGAAVRRESRVIADAFDLLNRKLTLLAGVVALESTVGGEHEQCEHQPSVINLSAAGLAVQATLALQADTWLAIDLVLLPGNQLMRAIGRVIECRPHAEGYAIGIEFDGLSEEERDILVAYVLRKQAQVLRGERGLGQPQR